MTEKLESLEGRPPAPTGEPQSSQPAPAGPLIVFGDDDDLVCVDDTCLPPGSTA